MKPTNKNTIIILILGSLMTVTPFAIDMYLPAFSKIATDFGITSSRVSLSLASYFVGLAIGQLIYGPLLDRFGRKRPLYYGRAIYIIACLGCMQSQSLEMLIAFRFIQAIGGCVAMVAAIAMVRDFFPVEQSAKILSLLMLILGVSPLLAPTVGGFITAVWGWPWVFIVLAIITFLITAVIYLFLPEGHQPDKSVSLKIKPLLNNYLSILKHPQFYTYTLSGAFSFAALFIYLAGSPVIFMEIFKVSPQAYGGIFALLSVGFIASNQLNILLLKRYSSEQIFRTGILLQVISTVVFLIGAWQNWYGLTGTIVSIFIALSCLGLTYPNASALALAPFTKNVGSASALIGSIQIGMSGLVSAVVGFFNSESLVPYVMSMVVVTLMAWIILVAGRSKLVLSQSA